MILQLGAMQTRLCCAGDQVRCISPLVDNTKAALAQLLADPDSRRVKRTAQDGITFSSRSNTSQAALAGRWQASNPLVVIFIDLSGNFVRADLRKQNAPQAEGLDYGVVANNKGRHS
jgi:hypothetical protein